MGLLTGKTFVSHEQDGGTILIADAILGLKGKAHASFDQEIFGWFLAIGKAQDALAVTDCVLFYINQADFNQVARKWPKALASILAKAKGLHRSNNKAKPPPLPDIVSSLSSSLRYIPMLVPPRPWTRWDSGGYIRLKPRVMRTHGSSVQVEALKRARLDRVFEALNALGRVRWRVNAPALGAIEDAWARSLAIAVSLARALGPR